MTWDIVVKIGHIVGTVLGVGGATMAEVFYTRAIRDGKIDESEGALLRGVYTVIRVGLIVLVVSGFGYLLLLRLEGHAQYIYSPRVWAKLTLTAILLFNAILLQTRKMPVWLGAGISLTSWYAALVIGAWRMQAGFWTIMGVYAAAILIVTYALHLIHKGGQKS